MAYVLYGSRYIGSGALPPVVAGFQAQDVSTGNLYEANTSASAWVQIGNVNQANLGMLPLTGGNMTGAITGATGFSPSDSPNFTTAAKKAGVDLATVTDLVSVQNQILASISPKVTEAIAASSSGLSLKSNVAWGMGKLVFAGGSFTATQSVPLPSYPDGTPAAESDCRWIVSPISLPYAVGLSGSDNEVLEFSADPTTTRTFCAYVKNTNHPGDIAYCRAVTVAYFIMGIRA